MIKVKLGAMMFLEFFIWGAWYVTIGTWLGQTLHFSGAEIGLVIGTNCIGAIISTFAAGWIADNVMPAQYMLSILHLVGAGLLYVTSTQTHFGALYVLVLLYSAVYMPTIGLANVVAFRQIKNSKTEFAPIRVLGTIGWICAGLIVGHLQKDATAWPLRLAAGASLIMGVYSLLLPHTPPEAKEPFTLSTVFPAPVRRMLRDRSFLTFAIASFLICVPLQFYYAFTNLFLNQEGVTNAAGKMTMGQMSELGCMLLIPIFFRRLGVKWMLVAGMSAWVLRYIFFAYGNPGPGAGLLLLGILLHGISYDFFFVTGQIYTDRKAPVAYRSAAQGLIMLITYGAGMLLGSWMSGLVVDRYSTLLADGSATHDWHAIWLVASACSAVVLVLFLIFFNDKEDEEDTLATTPLVVDTQMAQAIPEVSL